MSVQGSRTNLFCALVGLIISGCDGDLAAEMEAQAAQALTACTTFEFNGQVSETKPDYVEGDLRVDSRHPLSSRHLHMNGVYLRNHAGCCSTPYEFKLIDGSSFYIKDMSFSYASGTHTFTASGAVDDSVTPGANYAPQRKGWDAITSFQWDAGGEGRLESLTLCPPDPTPGSEEGHCRPGTPNSLGQIPFTYNRAAASRAAVSLSRRKPADISAVESLSHYSAYFMSLALRAGKLPMVDLDLDPSTIEDGWNASWADIQKDGRTVRKLNGNPVWRNHNATQVNAPQIDNRLIGYISGATSLLPDSGQYSFQYTNSTNFTSIDVGTLIDSSKGYTFNHAALVPLEPRLKSYQPGDYVYLNSMQGGQPLTHGLMVIGHGLPIKCRTKVLQEVVFKPCSSNSACQNTIDNSKNLPEDIYYDDLTVPYVVDWTTIQYQGPRPFYCTAKRDAQTDDESPGWFAHSFWMFIRVPSSGWVAQNIYVPPTVRVTPTGAIRECNMH